MKPRTAAMAVELIQSRIYTRQELEQIKRAAEAEIKRLHHIDICRMLDAQGQLRIEDE